MNLMENCFYQIGSYGPILLIIQSLFLLRSKEIYFYYYVIASFINILLNHFLKILIQEPRPSVDKKTFDLALKHMKSKNYRNSISYDVFGMPSGHTQSVLFSSTFVYLVLKHESWMTFFFYAVISLITMAQRIQYKFHTLNQVIVGGIIGTVFAYLVYYLASQKRKGELKEKEEENGPI
jgi:membrane-associated phospholipid phosphatase